MNRSASGKAGKSANATISPASKRARRRWLFETGAVLLGTSLLAVGVHLLQNVFAPAPVNLSLALLPLFYAPLVAVLMGLPVAALLLALVNPAVNHLLTGLPASETLPFITVHLTVFSALLILLLRTGRIGLRVLSPLVFLASFYLVAVPFSALPLPIAAASEGLPSIWQLLSQTWWGLVVLLLGSFFLDEWPERPA